MESDSSLVLWVLSTLTISKLMDSIKRQAGRSRPACLFRKFISPYPTCADTNTIKYRPQVCCERMLIYPVMRPADNIRG